MTVSSATELSPGERIEAQVVVVGGGPAGLTVALDLTALGCSVVVLESGGRQLTDEARDLDRGEVVGRPLRFGDVEMSTADVRLRALGGASGHWAGLCRPLDAIDLSARPWVPGSGWPIERSELDPWYESAAVTLELGTTGFSSAAWHQRAGTTPLLEDGVLKTIIVQGSRPVMFGVDLADRLEEADGPTVLVDATAVDASLDPTGGRIERLVVRTPSGSTHDVVGDEFVLAAGGYEVARLLLSWDGERGIANSSGLVGVGFSDHLHRWAGSARVMVDPELPPLYSWGEAPGEGEPARVWAGWSLSAAAQEAEQLASAAAFLHFGAAVGEPAVEPTAVSDAVGPLLAWEQPGRSPDVAQLDVRTEQSSDPASRITLGKERDASGLRRICLDWQPTDLDLGAGRRLVELLAVELGRAGIGRIEVDPGGTPYSSLPAGIGCHPMGTARMSGSPADGVVDADLRAHDVENLHVCSSAVFPTGGHANPTLTIVALAHRLADHLASA